MNKIKEILSKKILIGIVILILLTGIVVGLMCFNIYLLEKLGITPTQDTIHEIDISYDMLLFTVILSIIIVLLLIIYLVMIHSVNNREQIRSRSFKVTLISFGIIVIGIGNFYLFKEININKYVIDEMDVYYNILAIIGTEIALISGLLLIIIGINNISTPTNMSPYDQEKFKLQSIILIVIGLLFSTVGIWQSISIDVFGAGISANKMQKKIYKKITTRVDAGAYYSVGDVYYNNEQYHEALKEYKKAIMIDDEYAQAYYKIGRTLFELDKDDKTGKAYKN